MPIPLLTKLTQFISYIMSNYSVNSCKRIVHVDGSGVSHEIAKVVYCDGNRHTHTIWPCTVHLTDVYVVKLSKAGQGSDIAYSYTVDTNTLQPNVTLMPGSVYGVKGTLEMYDENNPGTLVKRIENCYFFPETINTNLDPDEEPFVSPTGNEAYQYGGRIATEYDSNNNVTNTYTIDYGQYTKWGVDSDPTHTGRMELQIGWWNANVGYAQNGFIFDPNYTTRMIFKRATINQEIKLANTSSNTGLNSGNFINSPKIMTLGETLTIYPKLHNYASDSVTNDSWETYENITLTSSNFTYDSSSISITSGSNGSWVIEPLVITGGISDVVISYNGYTFTLGIIGTPNTTYSFWSQGQPIGTSTRNISDPLSVWIKDDTTGEQYLGNNYTMHAVTPGIVSFNGTTIIPNAVGSTQVYAIVEGIETSKFTVNVTAVNTYYRAGSLTTSMSNGNTTYTINGNITSLNGTVNLSVVENTPYGIEFFADSNGTFEKLVYFDIGTTLPFVITSEDNGRVIGIVGTSSSGVSSISVPVYPNSNKTSGTELGTFVITKQ